MPLLIALVYFVVAIAIGTYAVAQYLTSTNHKAHNPQAVEAFAKMIQLLIVAAVWPIALIPIAAAAAFFETGPVRPRA